MGLHNTRSARDRSIPRSFAKMSSDEILDLTADVLLFSKMLHRGNATHSDDIEFVIPSPRVTRYKYYTCETDLFRSGIVFLFLDFCSPKTPTVPT